MRGFNLPADASQPTKHGLFTCHRVSYLKNINFRLNHPSYWCSLLVYDLH